MKILTASAFALALSLFAGQAAHADGTPVPVTPPATETKIVSNVINYAQTIAPVDRGGFAYILGLVGGTVTYTGPGPVFVTLRTGGQSYTSPVDYNGKYSFFVYANSGTINTEAWIPGVPSSHTPAQSELK